MAEKIPSRPEWATMLETTPLRDIVNPSQKIVSVNFFDYVSTLLQKLSEAKVLSAVVTTPDKPGIVGFVDVLDLIHFVVDATSESPDFWNESAQNVQWEGKSFSLEHVGNIMNKSERDQMQTVTLSTTLSEVANMFCVEVHRVAVIEGEKLVNVVSQSDMIEYLTKRGVYIGSKIERPIKEVGLEALGVASVLDTLTTLEVIRFLRDHQLSGAPVVDGQGRIVCNFSGSDLLGLTESTFQLLKLPVKEFLSRMYGFPKAPVCVRDTDTVEVVMLKMVVHKVHRVYIVDNTMRPTGVIAMTDLMQFFVAE